MINEEICGAERQTQVAEAMQKMNYAIDGMANVCQELSGRLNRVSREPLPMPNCGNDQETPVFVPLVEELNDMLTRLTNIHTHIEDQIQRLEI